MTTEKRDAITPGTVESYPVLPLRDIVVFPHMIVPLFVAREKSIRALEEVTKTDSSDARSYTLMSNGVSIPNKLPDVMLELF